MAYVPPFVGVAGLTIPSETDVQAALIADYRGIYGQNVYLGIDSADYQWISAVALKISDVLQAVQLAYNSRSPVTAVGSGLDSVVKINGIARKSASFSQCDVTVTGTANTLITNGVVTDVNGVAWILPSPITIPGGGTFIVTAICADPGNINANAGDLSIIATPTAGWISVTNASPAIPGQAIESDGQLRARQAISVSLSSRTMLSGTIAAIAATVNVTRWNVLENPTGTTDSFGNPAHSITAVVEGGTDADVANAIYFNRGIGCFTNGTTSVNVTDPQTGQLMPIRFDRPTYVPIFVSLSVHALFGFTTATQTAIKNAIVAYLNSLQIGQSVIRSELFGAALSVRPNPDAPMFSITALTLDVTATPIAILDISLLFTQVAQGVIGDVVLTLV